MKLMEALATVGLLNIDKVENKDIVAKRIELEKNPIYKDALEKTLYVESYKIILRQDNYKTMKCEDCGAGTNEIVKMSKGGKNICPDCVLKLLKTEAPKETVAKKGKGK